MARPDARSLARPPKDEWGVYDPQQAGLAALYARLEASDQRAAAAQATAVKKELSDPTPAPAHSTFRDE